MTEKIYDEEIAPKLLEIAKLCEAKRIPFLALTEWSPGKVGRTELKVENECIEMLMVRHCAKTAPNIDGYIIGLGKWAKEKNVRMDASIVMRKMFSDNNGLTGGVYTSGWPGSLRE